MKKIIVFRLLQLGSEWIPGARQRNIFNVPRCVKVIQNPIDWSRIMSNYSITFNKKLISNF